MKIKVLTKVAIILVSSSVIAPNIFAKNIRECGKRGPSKTTGELNNFREAKTNAVSGRNLVVFGNNEKNYPKREKMKPITNLTLDEMVLMEEDLTVQ